MPHVVLVDHGGLESWQIEPIPLTGLIEVPLVLDVLAEVVHCQCRRRSGLHWLLFLVCYRVLDYTLGVLGFGRLKAFYMHLLSLMHFSCFSKKLTIEIAPKRL